MKHSANEKKTKPKIGHTTHLTKSVCSAVTYRYIIINDKTHSAVWESEPNRYSDGARFLLCKICLQEVAIEFRYENRRSAPDLYIGSVLKGFRY